MVRPGTRPGGAAREQNIREEIKFHEKKIKEHKDDMVLLQEQLDAIEKEKQRQKDLKNRGVDGQTCSADRDAQVQPEF